MQNGGVSVMISRTSKRNIGIFVLLFSLNAVWNYLSCFDSFRFLNITGINSFVYALLTIGWTITIFGRVLSKMPRRFLVAGGILLSLLFPLRQLRWNFTQTGDVANRLLWYAYYIVMVLIPLLSFCAALSVGIKQPCRLLRKTGALWTLAGALTVLILTNDIHNLMFLIKDGDYYRHQVLYYVFFAWSTVLTLFSFFILLHRCRVDASRRLAFVPVCCTLPFLLLLLWYTVNGGSPKLLGENLFNFHEAFLLFYIVMWESFLQIGLIPSNTDYHRLFEEAHISAAVFSKQGKLLVQSKGYSELGKTEPVPGIVRRKQKIRGGYVKWFEDHSPVQKTNEKLQEVTEEMGAQNLLIEEENRLRTEREALHLKNELYDRIARSVRHQVDMTLSILSEDKAGSGEFLRRLSVASCLGAYIKRRANLTILAEQNTEIMTTELYFAIRESQEYLQQLGILCGLYAVEKRERKIRAATLIAAYDIFEAFLEWLIFEQPKDTLGITFAVTFYEASIMEMALDVPEDFFTNEFLKEQEGMAEQAGAILRKRKEDDTMFFLIQEKGEEI